ncbi:MAG: sigma-54 dependent transcriptional regulator [candidate division Zixibacteria bacterium]|nr:sigma-54 dependent transcriptional regulator [candidate division Zixibacteria bacterium]
MKNTRLLVVDDESSARQLLAGFLRQNGFEIHEAADGESALDTYRKVLAPVALIDLKMPGMGGLELLKKLKEINPLIQVIVLTAFGSVESAVTAMQAGAYDYLTKPVQELSELLVKLQKAAEANRLIRENEILTRRINELFPGTEILGESTAIKKVREMISVVAPRDATVLITGPSGTGKELVARALHALSPRAGRKLVALNCAAFPESLLESELFGYEKGAFTGADRTKPGRFELAEGGTLFLDEIGEMPLTMQVKLLRVIEERVLERLGSVNATPLDIRIITATNRDLEKLISLGTFREDLYYRLNVIRIHVPPLSERSGDLLLLAKHFINKYTKKIGKEIWGIEADAAKVLIQYSWPGNVRELENVIERAIILANGTVITKEDLAGLSISETTPEPSGKILPLSEVEKEHIRFCLDRFGWNLGETAECLGLHRNTLRAKIKEFNLQK